MSARWRKSSGDRRPHVGTGIEQLGGNLVEARPEPIETAIDRRSFITRQFDHRAGVPMCPRNGFGDSETPRPALVRRIVHISAFPLDQLIDQILNTHTLTSLGSTESLRDNHIGSL